jgi:hypothetical protein
MQVRHSGTGYMSDMSDSHEHDTGQTHWNRMHVRQSGTEYLQVIYSEVVFRYNT